MKKCFIDIEKDWQREFIRYVAVINGYGLDWNEVDKNENIIASHESVNGDNSKLERIITNLIYEFSEEETILFKDVFNG